MTPLFTDQRVLDFFDKEIPENSYEIFIRFETVFIKLSSMRNSRQSIVLQFFTNSGPKYLGYLYYNNTAEFPQFDGCVFYDELPSGHEVKIYSRGKCIEMLLEYPEFKEWLLWNQL